MVSRLSGVVRSCSSSGVVWCHLSCHIAYRLVEKYSSHLKFVLNKYSLGFPAFIFFNALEIRWDLASSGDSWGLCISFHQHGFPLTPTRKCDSALTSIERARTKSNNNTGRIHHTTQESKPPYANVAAEM